MQKIFTKIRKLLRDNRGFTLMEMMIVVAIIAILSAIAIPKFSSSLAVANTSKVRADLQTINTAAALYYTEKGDFPANISDLEQYLDSGKLSKPTGKIMIQGELTDIPSDSSYTYDKSTNSAKFMEKDIEAFTTKTSE